MPPLPPPAPVVVTAPIAIGTPEWSSQLDEDNRKSRRDNRVKTTLMILVVVPMVMALLVCANALLQAVALTFIENFWWVAALAALGIAFRFLEKAKWFR